MEKEEGRSTTIDLAGTYQYVTVTPGDIINITCLPDENLLNAFYSSNCTND